MSRASSATRSAFEALAKTVLPAMLRDHDAGRPVRVWIAGCSTGEEVYSIAMLLREGIAASKRELKLQIFASDIDADAVATAREGLYPASIEADVSPERLAAFFSREDEFYRVTSDLRANIVFAVHDLLSDPPFARLDFISCRNVLIYLGPEAQAQAVRTFHFALRDGGILFVGAAEAVGASEEGFAAALENGAHLSPRRRRPADAIRLPRRASGKARKLRARPGTGVAQTRQSSIAELCRRVVAESYGPAAVLITHKLECLHFQGPTDRFLKVASGPPEQDLIAKARDGVRAPLRSAIQRALRDNARSVVSGGRIEADDAIEFDVVVEPLVNEREPLLLVCFVERPAPARAIGGGNARDGIACGRRSRAGTRKYAARTQKRGEEPRIFERRANGDQRRGDVGQRGISIDERGVARLQGGTAIPERRAERPQQPIGRDARSAAHHCGRSAERALQHGRRDDLSWTCGSISASLRRPRRPSSMSFRATLAGPWPT